jgi:Transposase DNA-binding
VEDSSAVTIMGEFEDIDLGHEKRDRRLKRVVAALAVKPDASFPEAMGRASPPSAPVRTRAICLSARSSRHQEARRELSRAACRPSR